MRGATGNRDRQDRNISHFNPRSPCGERPEITSPTISPEDISIHAPRAGSDHRDRVKILIGGGFQSTLPVRGATGERCRSDELFGHFNPRSPCGERHARIRAKFLTLGDFNPRSPCGERQEREFDYYHLANFNPRSPCGERRILCALLPCPCVISIHAPRAGSDPISSASACWRSIFQSTLPVRGATF